VPAGLSAYNIFASRDYSIAPTTTFYYLLFNCDGKPAGRQPNHRGRLILENMDSISSSPPKQVWLGEVGGGRESGRFRKKQGNAIKRPVASYFQIRIAEAQLSKPSIAFSSR
jgi:hypothetical protein